MNTTNYWWVNQNQTFKHEVNGGYMWSPKRGKPNKKTGTASRIQFYENMKEVVPGDIVFSFNNTVLACVGIITSYCFEAPLPLEFAKTGEQWEREGWKVSVNYRKLITPIRPAEHIEQLRPLLPLKYSPLRPDGNGNQVYLSRISPELASVLTDLIGPEAKTVVDLAGKLPPPDPNSSEDSDDIQTKENEIEKKIASDPKIHETEKRALIKARKGQGLFRKRVAKIEKQCRVSGVVIPLHLIASHIKPWCKSDNRERLDGENGLLLAPHIDHLFDKGFISFEGDGSLVISPAADRGALRQMGIPLDAQFNTGLFTKGQQRYLKYHRAEKFKKAVSK